MIQNASDKQAQLRNVLLLDNETIYTVRHMHFEIRSGPDDLCSSYLLAVVASMLPFGTAPSMRSHSPLKAFISQLLSPGPYQISLPIGCWHRRKPTIIDHPVCIMEINSVIGIREDMDIIVLNAGKVEFIQKGQ
jgi:hypothetical protein